MMIRTAPTPSLTNSLNRLILNSLIIKMIHLRAGSLVSTERASKLSSELREPSSGKKKRMNEKEAQS